MSGDPEMANKGYKVENMEMASKTPGESSSMKVPKSIPVGSVVSFKSEKTTTSTQEQMQEMMTRMQEMQEELDELKGRSRKKPSSQSENSFELP